MKQLARVVPVIIAILCAACGTSDETIATNVRAQLAAAATIDASQVSVEAKSQVVTLSGTVATAAARDEAVRVARSATGVRDVVDQLQISQAASVPSAPDRPAATSAQAPVEPATNSAAESGAASVETTAATKESGGAVGNAAKTTGSRGGWGDAGHRRGDRRRCQGRGRCHGEGHEGGRRRHSGRREGDGQCDSEGRRGHGLRSEEVRGECRRCGDARQEVVARQEGLGVAERVLRRARRGRSHDQPS